MSRRLLAGVLLTLAIGGMAASAAEKKPEKEKPVPITDPAIVECKVPFKPATSLGGPGNSQPVAPALVGPELADLAKAKTVTAAKGAVAIDVPNGKITLAADRTHNSRADIPLATMPGRKYIVTFDVSGGSVNRKVGTTSNGNQLALQALASAAGSTLTFVATGESSWLNFNKTTGSVIVSNISVKEASAAASSGTANEEQIQNFYTAVRRYQAQLADYRSCIEAKRQVATTAGDRVQLDALNKSYDQSVDDETAVVTAFNETLKAYRARKP